MEQHVREAIETFVTRVRRDLDVHLRTLATELLRFTQETQDVCRADMERALSDAREDAERSFRSRVESIRVDLAREMELRLAAEPRPADRDEPSVQRDRAFEPLGRLLAAIRRIDETTTLTGILETLAKAAAETVRVAIFLVDGEALRPWSHFGFPAGAGPTDIAIGRSGVLAAAVALRQTSFVPPTLDHGEASAPAFMRVPAGHTGLVRPIVVAGEVVAVLYADDVDRQSPQASAHVWTEELELLVRHASARLETVTSERTVEVLTRPV